VVFAANGALEIVEVVGFRIVSGGPLGFFEDHEW
jgi:hypothetical protein